VKPGGAILCEASFEEVEEDSEEQEADADALEILTGNRSPQAEPVYGMTAAKLKAECLRQQALKGVHAGTLALIYGKTAKRMPVAVNTLKLLNMSTGARAIIAGALGRRLLGVAGQTAADLPEAALDLLPLFGLDALA
jgi:hypothetical protein